MSLLHFQLFICFHLLLLLLLFLFLIFILFSIFSTVLTTVGVCIRLLVILLFINDPLLVEQVAWIVIDTVLYFALQRFCIEERLSIIEGISRIGIDFGLQNIIEG